MENGRRKKKKWRQYREENALRRSTQMSEKRELRKMCAREGASERERPAQLRTTSSGELQSESAAKEYGVQREIALALRYHQKGDGEVSCLSFSLFLFLTAHTKGKNGDSRMQDGDAEREREKTGTGAYKKKFTIDLRSTVGPVPVCVATAAFSLEQQTALHPAGAVRCN